MRLDRASVVEEPISTMSGASFKAALIGRPERERFLLVDLREPEEARRLLAKAPALASLEEPHGLRPTLDEAGRLAVGAAVGGVRSEEGRDSGLGRSRRPRDRRGSLPRQESREVRRLHGEARLGRHRGGQSRAKEGVLDALSSVERIDGPRVGMSSGSACKTSEVAGAGVPTLTAVINARRALEGQGLFGGVPS